MSAWAWPVAGSQIRTVRSSPLASNACPATVTAQSARTAPRRPFQAHVLEAQDLTREPDLVPVRQGRMMVSPFTFYRGAAKIMAADLGSMPAAGPGVQLLRRSPMTAAADSSVLAGKDICYRPR